MNSISKRSITGLARASAAVGCLATASAAVVMTDRNEFLGWVQPGYYLEPFQTVERGFLPADEGDDWEVAFVGPNGDFAFTMQEEPFELIPQSQLWVIANETMDEEEIPGSRAVSTRNDFTGIRIQFTSGNVTAVGGDFFLTQENGAPLGIGSFTLTLSDGTAREVNSQLTESDRFVGFLAEGSETFTSLILNPVDIFQGQYVTVDNLLVGAAVPEPATAGWLAGAALLGFGGWRRWANRGRR